MMREIWCRRISTDADAWGTGVGFIDAKWASAGSDQKRTVADIVADAEKLTVTSAVANMRVARTVVGDNVEFYQRYLGVIMIVR